MLSSGTLCNPLLYITLHGSQVTKINKYRKKKCKIVMMTAVCIAWVMHFVFYSFCILDGNIQKALHTSGSGWKQLSWRTKMSPILRKSKSWLTVESLWSKNSRRFTSSGNTEQWRNATMNQSINLCFCRMCQTVQYICQRLNHYFLYISECLYLIYCTITDLDINIYFHYF